MTNEKNNEKDGLLTRSGVSLIIPFILVTLCFALWGFANDATAPMVKAFSKIFRMSVTDGAMVQVAFYLGYFAMAFPAAMFIQKYSFKAGVLIGLTLFGIGAFLFFPAKLTGMYYTFLLAYFVMTCGLSFLETSCNPYIYCMGSEETATQRLNLAQAFNPIGALVGMYVAMRFVQSKLCPLDTEARYALPQHQFDIVKNYDLGILIRPYIAIGVVVLIVALIIKLKKMPMNGDTRLKKSLWTAMKEIFAIKNYREGVIAQFFYIGAQVTCWTFIIQYGTRVFMAEGMQEKAAEILSQKYNILAMILFTCGRFICTWFLKFIQPGRLLSLLAIVGAIAMMGVICFTDRNGVYCLVIVSGCMSLMFPTIYGIALRGLDDNVKFGGAGLIMAILGGSFFPPIQAMIIDVKGDILGLPSTNISFIIPFICFIVVAVYGHRAYVRHHIYHDYNK